MRVHKRYTERIACPACGKTNVVYKGYNGKRTKRRIYCKDCASNYYIPIDQLPQSANEESVKEMVSYQTQVLQQEIKQEQEQEHKIDANAPIDINEPIDVVAEEESVEYEDSDEVVLDAISVSSATEELIFGDTMLDDTTYKKKKRKPIVLNKKDTQGTIQATQSTRAKPLHHIFIVFGHTYNLLHTLFALELNEYSNSIEVLLYMSTPAYPGKYFTKKVLIHGYTFDEWVAKHNEIIGFDIKPIRAQISDKIGRVWFNPLQIHNMGVYVPNISPDIKPEALSLYTVYIQFANNTVLFNPVKNKYKAHNVYDALLDSLTGTLNQNELFRFNIGTWHDLISLYKPDPTA